MRYFESQGKKREGGSESLVVMMMIEEMRLCRGCLSLYTSLRGGNVTRSSSSPPFNPDPKWALIIYDF